MPLSWLLQVHFLFLGQQSRLLELAVKDRTGLNQFLEDRKVMRLITGLNIYLNAVIAARDLPINHMMRSSTITRTDMDIPVLAA
jgi:hypothetical protein